MLHNIDEQNIQLLKYLERFYLITFLIFDTKICKLNICNLINLYLNNDTE